MFVKIALIGFNKRHLYLLHSNVFFLLITPIPKKKDFIYEMIPYTPNNIKMGKMLIYSVYWQR